MRHRADEWLLLKAEEVVIVEPQTGDGSRGEAEEVGLGAGLPTSLGYAQELVYLNVS